MPEEAEQFRLSGLTASTSDERKRPEFPVEPGVHSAGLKHGSQRGSRNSTGRRLGVCQARAPRFRQQEVIKAAGNHLAKNAALLCDGLLNRHSDGALLAVVSRLWPQVP